MPVLCRRSVVPFFLFALISASAPAQPNLVVNGGFTQNLVPWTWDARYLQAPGAEAWSSRDANNATNSGSLLLRVDAEGRARQLLQCVNLIPGQVYEFGARVFFPAEQTIVGDGLIAYVEFPQEGCKGGFTGFGELKFVESTRRGNWILLSAKPPTAPSARSIQVILGSALRTAGSFTAYFDDAYVRLVPPSVVVTAQPGALVQTPGNAGATARYTLTNVGESAAAVTLSQDAAFFSQTPTAFTIPARGSQEVVITAFAVAQGNYAGRSLIVGDGVPAGLEVPVRLAAVPTSDGSPNPTERRIDLSGSATAAPFLTNVAFTNPTSGTVRAVLTSDAPWLRPSASAITIVPGGTTSVQVEIDRSRRSEAEFESASVSGALRLSYLASSRAQGDRTPLADSPVSSVTVTVKDSVAKPIDPTKITPAESEIGVFFPGVGHVQGSVGTFISDLVISASKTIGLDPLVGVYFTPAGGEPLKLNQKLVPNQLLVLSDVVKSYFGRSGETGTLQVRLTSPDLLSLSAAVINKSGVAGTYGTAIPALRSDRAAAPGQSTYLTGLIGSSPAAHTNVVLQETAGKAASVDLDFLSSGGQVVSTRRDVRIAPFASVRLDDAVPVQGVSAKITVRSDHEGRVMAYATPVDKALESDGSRRGGDTWAVADWPRTLGYMPSSPVVIPVVGVVRGANNTLFRTDITLMNTTAAEATGRLTFYPRGGVPVIRDVRLGAQQTVVHANAIETLFAVQNQVGFVTFVPVGGSSWLVAARIFATTGQQIATFGTGVPVVSLESAMRAGQTRRIAGFDDAGAATIAAATPATFRSNLGLIETSGQPVRVRVTLHNAVPEGATALSSALSFKEFTLAAYEVLSINGISQFVLGERRANYRTDLKDLFVDITVLSGSGSVIPYLSSVDNGSADQVLQIPAL